MTLALDASVIPLNDLKRSTRALQVELRAAIEGVLSSGTYILGKQVEAFEATFAEYCGVGHCVGVANGTDALEIALRALGCGHGDEVVTVANAGMYGSTAILAVGARPSFADVDPAAMTMDPASLQRCLSPRTRAIIVPHLYGRLADIQALSTVAGTIPIVEDCAQAHGAERGARKAGSFGRLGCYSFYPTKNLGALGDGGAIVTDSAELAAVSRALRQYGWKEKYVAELPGGRNSRLDDVQAAVLLAKLPYLEGWNARRRAIVGRYRQAAAGTELIVPDASASDAVAHLCVIQSSQRDRLQRLFRSAGVDTGIHYPVPDHRQPALAGLTSSGPLPVTEALATRVLTLPCFPELSEYEIDRVAGRLTEFATQDA